MLEDQIVSVDEDRKSRQIAKDKREILSNSLQNPSDPDATFRRKGGKDYKGYVGNVVETVCDDGLDIVTTMDFAQNTHSDSQFMKNYLAQRGEDAIPETMVTGHMAARRTSGWQKKKVWSW